MTLILFQKRLARARKIRELYGIKNWTNSEKLSLSTKPGNTAEFIAVVRG